VQAHYWASLHKASYVVLEHRFYGKSLPFDLLTTDNLKYHRSQQALADAAQCMSSSFFFF
jgi:thymus-specific serine protease